MSEPRPPLWRRRQFAAFWLGESISHLGSHITDLALPLTAVLLLGATADQMGILAAAGYAPFLVVGLLAGVWVDRYRRRPMLIAADLISALAVAAVPLAAVSGLLRIEVLYAVAFVLGCVAVIWTVAYQSFLPTLVGREDLVDANSKLEATNSIGTVGGPSLGGFLVQVVGAPLALVADALSYLVSAAFLLSIRVTEPPPIPDDERGSTLEQVREGLRLVRRSPILMAIVEGGATHNFFMRMIDALFVLYATVELRLEPVVLGLVLAASGPGALAGAIVAGRVAGRLGIGPTIVAMQVLTGVSRVLLAIAGGPAVVVIVILASGEFLMGFARTVFNVNQVSLRVAITPDRMHGRMNATVRFVMWSVTPVGALAGGLLASSALGIRATMAVAAVGVTLATLAFLARPIRTLRAMPALPAAVDAA